MRCALFFLAALISATPVLARKAPLDQNLIANYTIDPTSVQFIVCGGVANTDGCFGSAGMNPFEQACAVLEGETSKNGDVLTRAIYVLDKRTSKDDPMILYVYSRQDTITDTNDAVSVSLVATVPLGITGGKRAKCFMAGNSVAVYAGSDADTTAAILNKGAFTVTTVGDFGPQHLHGIDADDRGWVSLHFESAFTSYNPNGVPEFEGGGIVEFVGTKNAVTP